MNIVYSEWGLANRYDDEIELNVNLKKSPKLHEQILDHELRHEPGNYSRKDLKHDLTEHSVNFLTLMKFYWKYPKSLFQFVPIYKHPKHGWVKDNSLLILYSILLIIVFLGVYLGFKI